VTETNRQGLGGYLARMTRPPSAEELEQLAKVWFSQAHALSAQDEAEIAAWKKEHRKWTHFTGSGGGISGVEAGFFSSGESGDCGGD
jgi:hypothetical protein